MLQLNNKINKINKVSNQLKLLHYASSVQYDLFYTIF